MSSLSAHLRLTEDHSRLRFHPSCPICQRDRLAGSLSGDELVSRRVQAALAAGLIAVSTSGVSVAVASEPDEVSDGTSEVLGPGDPSSSAGFDPGGETVQLPDAPPAAPEVVHPPAEASDDLGALEQEPAQDVAEKVVPEPTGEAPPLSEAPTAAAPAPAPTPAPAPAVPPSDIAPEAAVAPPEDVAPKAEKAERHPARTAKDTVETTRRAIQPVPSAAPSPPPAPTPVTTRVVASTTSTSTTTASSRAAPGDRFHVVARGESLWSIAGDALGDRASVARIAREVNRLWELNEDSIASGDPDLLFAGTRLRLR